MNVLDLVLLGAIALAMFGGFRAGLLARAGSWVGLVVGFYLAIRAVPAVVEAMEASSSNTRLLVAVAVVVSGAFVGQAIGLLAGSRLRGVLPPGPARMADRAAGGALGGLSVVVTLWLLLPSLSDVPGWPARETRSSAVARFVDDTLPRPPDTMQALRSLVGEQGFPRVFDALRPAPDVGAPPQSSGLAPEVEARVKLSTVKVVGEACRRIQEGSGFAADTNVVVTNAHVVAGEDSVEVIRPDGRRLRATVAVFDPARDLAVLRVAGLGQTPLGRDRASAGDTGAVFGHPGGQDEVRAAPAKISRQVEAVGRDIYNRRATRREVFIMAADLAPGDSGGALVDTQGRVVGVAFAIAPDRPGTSYAVTTSELDAVLERFAANPAASEDTQACLAG